MNKRIWIMRSSLNISAKPRLGTDLAPGDYVLQVVVTDLLAEEPRRTASSWIDFEIAD
jgi:hypothetical protein